MNSRVDPFGSLSVVDFGTGLSAALVARMLKDAGAALHRVEPASGDPFYGEYAAYAYWREDTSRATAPDAGAAVESAASRLKNADVCIVGGEDHPELEWRPDVERLARDYPRLVILDIVGSALEKGRPAVELLAQAENGLVFEHLADRPVAFAFQAASYGAALQGMVGVSAALCERNRSGAGQIVRTSYQEGVMNWLGHNWFVSERTDAAMEYQVPKGVRQLIFQCKDGKFLHFALGTHGGKRHLYKVLGIDDPDIEKDPRGLPSHARGPLDFFGDIDLIQKHVEKWDRDDLLGELCAFGMPADAVHEPGVVWDDVQTTCNGIIVTDPHGNRRVGAPFKITAVDAPRARIAERPQYEGHLPLGGLRVLDLGMYTAGPHASVLLRDLGADVIKVEPLSGDPIRRFFRPITTSNRGKAAIAVDMKSADGLEIVRRLAATVDVVQHNFRPGVAERLGIGVDALRERKPDLIVLENSGYGAKGPKSSWGGLDMIFQALGGHEYRAAGAGNAPQSYRLTVVDFTAGILGAIATLMAIHQKQTSGKSATITTSLLDSGIYMLSELVESAGSGFCRLPKLDSEQGGFHPAERIYAARDGWIAIAARGEAMAARLLRVLKLEQRISRQRAQWGEDEKTLIAASIAERESAPLLRELEDGQVWAVRCDPDAQRRILTDRELIARDAVVRSEDEKYGEVLQIGSLYSLSRSRKSVVGNLPSLGQHTRQILERLGYGPSEVQALYERGVVA